jgi:hypothetical protein
MYFFARLRIYIQIGIFVIIAQGSDFPEIALQNCKSDMTTPLSLSLTPGITEKKVPPRHQSRYIGSTLDVAYRKLKVVEAPITFALGS